MPVNRRLFLSSLATGIAGAALAEGAHTVYGNSPQEKNTGIPKELENLILYSGGQSGNLLSDTPYHLRGGKSCVLTEIRLKDGSVRRTHIPIEGAHFPFISPKHNRIVMLDQYGTQGAVLDMDHRLIKLLDAPEGYFFSGHGLLLEGTDRMVASLYFRNPASIADQGRLMVINIGGEEPVIEDLVPSHGLQPHDMAYMPGHDMFAIAHAGSTFHYYGVKDKRYLREIVEPGISLVRASDLQQVKFLKTPLPAEITHLDVRDDGKIVCCLQQQLNTSGQTSADADKMIAEEFPQKDILFKPIEMEHGRHSHGVSLSLPALLVDPDTGESTPFMINKTHQRHAQSVRYHRQTGTTVVTYLLANGLLFLDKDNKAEVIPASDLGLYSVASVADLPDTPYMAIGGVFDDVAIVDMRTRRTVHTIRVPLLNAAHLTVRSVQGA
ncbi:MAG: DUF1513 domain-containing protein [Proteobacteria bacterium]|nr:DUF1513 domain-containing protein [Pseudomonadota bacterium]